MVFNPKEHLIRLPSKKGEKDYLEVQWRLVWFREDHPNGLIRADLVSTHPPIIQATITSEGGQILATGLAGIPESGGGKIWSGREVEKAETAAIGRALAHAGYGTQFSGDEMDDSDYMPDSPVQRTKSHIDDKRETRLDTKPDEKPAQPKGTVQRPFKTVEALVEWLQGEALNIKASDKVIDQGKASNIAQAMAKFLNENSRHYLLWLAWEIESSKELNEREWLTLKAWCAAPIAHVEAEAKLVEAAYASAVEKDLANNG